MVLIGHSMGGLVSRLQTIDSGDEFWRLVSDASLDQLHGDAKFQDEMSKWFFFKANPSVRRVITIGTPYRGSRMSNNTTQWLSSKFIELPSTVAGLKSGL